jgi:hypothetical protein
MRCPAREDRNQEPKAGKVLANERGDVSVQRQTPTLTSTWVSRRVGTERIRLFPVKCRAIGDNWPLARALATEESDVYFDTAC